MDFHEKGKTAKVKGMMTKKPVTRFAYCHYVLVSQINDTVTNFADHREQCSHDAINRSLRKERLTPRLVWDNVASHIVRTPSGSIVFDDTVQDTNHAFAITLVRRQDRSNASAVSNGIGVVPSSSIHPDTDQVWLIA